MASGCIHVQIKFSHKLINHTVEIDLIHTNILKHITIMYTNKKNYFMYTIIYYFFLGSFVAPLGVAQTQGLVRLTQGRLFINCGDTSWLRWCLILILRNVIHHDNLIAQYDFGKCITLLRCLINGKREAWFSLGQAPASNCMKGSNQRKRGEEKKKKKEEKEEEREKEC